MDQSGYSPCRDEMVNEVLCPSSRKSHPDHQEYVRVRWKWRMRGCYQRHRYLTIAMYERCMVNYNGNQKSVGDRYILATSTSRCGAGTLIWIGGNSVQSHVGTFRGRGKVEGDTGVCR